jgi:hypothetical protein
MLPNFFVVGAQKCATTSLHHYLNMHADVYLPAQKETKFFVDDGRYARGLVFYESAYFSDWEGEKIIGEVDPDYMYFDRALERIVKDLDIDNVRFVFIFRNPVDRAFSHYLMSLRRGLESLSFEEALLCEKYRINRDYKFKLHYSYKDRGFYYKQVLRFIQYVDKSQMYFLLTEDLRNDPVKCLRSLFSFLNISKDFDYNIAKNKYRISRSPRSRFLLRRIMANGIEKKLIRFLVPSRKLRANLRQRIISMNETGDIKISLSVETRKMLTDIYLEENLLLGQLIGRDLGHWNCAVKSE